MSRYKTIIAVILVSLGFSFSLAAQEMTVRGSVLDSLERRPLDSVSITLVTSLSKRQVFTDAKGGFLLQWPAQKDSVYLHFQLKGFESRNIKIPANSRDLGTILLTPLSKLMEDIVIRSRVPAVVLRNDTTEYTIDSFDRKKNAVIGDLLRDLPGIEIDVEGNITHNGKPVTRILVNGEDFFGGDRDVALRNLPADIVSKLQVMDTKTKEQLLNGLQSDGEDKTINIKLKSGLQAFGTATAAAGTQGQRNANLMANLMEGKKHAGIMGSLNNSNRKGLTNNRLKSGAHSLGMQYRNQLYSELMMNSSINSSRNQSMQESRRLLQQYFRADSSFTTDSYHLSDFANSNHQANLTLDLTKKDGIHANLNVVYTGGESSSTSFSKNALSENGQLKNQSIRNGTTKGKSDNLSLSLQLGHRFRKKGRSLSVNIRAAYGHHENDFRNDADNIFYSDGQFLKKEILRQHIVSSASQRSAGIGITYMEPIAEKLRLQLTQQIDFSSHINERVTYNVDTVSKVDYYDSTYSNRWQARNYRTAGNAALVYELEKLYLSAGVQLIGTNAERKMERQATVEQKQQSYAPHLTANYKMSKTRSLRFNFSSQVHNPTIDQLQPVADNSNPMFIKMGNPSLKPSFQQQYNLSYQSNGQPGRTVSLGLGFSPVTNSIVNAIYFDEFRKRTSRFINVRGVYNIRGTWNISRTLGRSQSGGSWGLSGNAGYGRNVFFDRNTLLFTNHYSVRQTMNYARVQLDPKKRSRLSGALSATYNRTLSPGNTSGINSRNFSLSPRVDWNYRMTDFLEVTVNYQASLNRLNYNAATSAPTKYTDHQVATEIEGSLTKKISLESQFSFRHNGRLPAGSDNRQMWLWNLNASMKVFRNEKGQITLSAMDLLNQNADINRIIGDHFMEDVQTARQVSYFMLQFQYNLRKAPKKKDNRVS